MRIEVCTSPITKRAFHDTMFIISCTYNYMFLKTLEIKCMQHTMSMLNLVIDPWIWGARNKSACKCIYKLDTL